MRRPRSAPTSPRSRRCLPQRALALDAGTGDGSLLEVLAPVYERVVAIDRSDAQLAHARERAAARGFANVTFVQGELDGRELMQAVRAGAKHAAGADAVFASRVLHHAPQPERVVAQLASLCAPGGALVVLDYASHDDESMRAQADTWLGFERGGAAALCARGVARRRASDEHPRAALRRGAGQAPALAGNGGPKGQNGNGKGRERWRTTTR